MLQLIALIGGIYLIVQTIIDRDRGRESLHWPKVQGKIIAATKNFIGVPIITYEYNREGQIKTSKRVAFTQAMPPKIRREIIANYPVGKEVTVYYSPKDSSLEVLEPGIHPGTKFALWQGIIIVAAMIFISFLTVLTNA